MQINLEFKQLKEFKELLTRQRKGDTTRRATVRSESLTQHAACARAVRLYKQPASAGTTRDRNTAPALFPNSHPNLQSECI